MESEPCDLEITPPVCAGGWGRGHRHPRVWLPRFPPQIISEVTRPPPGWCMDNLRGGGGAFTQTTRPVTPGRSVRCGVCPAQLCSCPAVNGLGMGTSEQKNTELIRELRVFPCKRFQVPCHAELPPDTLLYHSALTGHHQDPKGVLLNPTWYFFYNSQQGT